MHEETRFGIIGGVGDTDRITPIRVGSMDTPVEADATDAESQPASAKQMVMLTNHGAALLFLHTHADARVRDVADALRITERATARILADLKTSGHLRVTHANRRNRYEVTGMLPLHPGESAARTMADLVMRISSLTMSAFVGGTNPF